MHTRFSVGLLAFTLFLGFLEPAKAAAPEDQIPAVILKVEGDGVANVRKHSGVVESAGARGKVYVGDRVITDARSAVHLMLNDGSVLKIGFSSEFTLEKVENNRKYLSWFFKLVHGTIRALVEKVPTQETHLRIETQSGTIGVRGTEFVLAYDEATSSSSVFMLEGVVSYGVANCEKAHTCLDVRGGESATMAKDALKPNTPSSYTLKDLFAVGKVGTRDTEARMSLFKDARRAQVKSNSFDEVALKKLIDEAMSELAAAQDRAIGRTKEQREAMHEAIKNGTYQATLSAADSYSASQGVFTATSNGGAENLVAQVAASKFRLGDAVKKADAAGLFLDKPADGSSVPDASGSDHRAYKLKKDVDYDQSTAAKADKEALLTATDDYKDTLSYAEALSASQVSSGDKPKAEDEPYNAAAEATKLGLARIAAAKAAANCDAACVAARIAHEVDVASEGSVAAYQHAHSAAAAEAVRSRRGRGGLPGSVTTRFLHRTVPGNSCFRTQSKCTMQPCSSFGHGKKCKAGETVQVCEGKQVPVRCEDN
jgi:hypothetical protein